MGWAKIVLWAAENDLEDSPFLSLGSGIAQPLFSFSQKDNK